MRDSPSYHYLCLINYIYRILNIYKIKRQTYIPVSYIQISNLKLVYSHKKPKIKKKKKYINNERMLFSKVFNRQKVQFSLAVKRRVTIFRSSSPTSIDDRIITSNPFILTSIKSNKKPLLFIEKLISFKFCFPKFFLLSYVWGFC